MANPKEPFIPQSDRPDVKIDPDKAVSELTVRDLQSILGSNEILKFRKDSFKEWKETYKEYLKDYIKEYAYEKDFRIELQNYPSIPVNPGDPFATGINQLAAHIGGLHKKIDELADQVAELKKSK